MGKQKYLHFFVNKDFFYSDRFDAIESLEEGPQVACVLIKLFLLEYTTPGKRIEYDPLALSQLCHVRKDTFEKYIDNCIELNLIQIYEV